MDNRFKGEVTVNGVGVLVYDWDAIGRLVDALGADFDTKISEAATALDMKIIATALSIGAGVSVDDVMRASPPIRQAMDAINTAFILAFHGHTGVPQNATENPTQATTGVALLWTRLKTRALRVFSR